MAAIVWDNAPTDSAEKERRKHRNNFMMDFENYALEKWSKSTPKGPDRYKEKAWAEHMQGMLVDADTTWDEYCSWVRAGLGDEYFQIDEPSTPPPPPLLPLTRW